MQRKKVGLGGQSRLGQGGAQARTSSETGGLVPDSDPLGGTLCDAVHLKDEMTIRKRDLNVPVPNFTELCK